LNEPVSMLGRDLLGDAKALFASGYGGGGDADRLEGLESRRPAYRLFGEPAAAEFDPGAVVGFGEGADLYPLFFVGGMFEFPVAYIDAYMGNLTGFTGRGIEEDQITVFEISGIDPFAHFGLLAGDPGDALHIHTGVAVVDQSGTVEGIRPFLCPDIGLAQLFFEQNGKGLAVGSFVFDSGLVNGVVVFGTAAGNGKKYEDEKCNAIFFHMGIISCRNRLNP